MSRNFTGTTDVVAVGDSTSLRTPSTAITAACWINPDSTQTNWATPLYKGRSDGNHSYGFGQNDTSSRQYRGYIRASLATYTSLTTQLSANTWYFLVLRWAGAAVSLRVYNADGSINQTVTSDPDSGTIDYEALDFKVGPLFSGKVAGVYVTNVSLTDDEVLALLRGSRPRQASAVDWPLWGVASPEADLSGNGNNGTVTGATAANHAPVAGYVTMLGANVGWLESAGGIIGPFPTFFH